MPRTPENQGPHLPRTEENEPDGFTLIEETFADVSAQQIAVQAMAEIRINELTSQLTERDKLIGDVVAERNKIREALLDARDRISDVSVELETLQAEHNKLLMPPLGYAVIAGINQDDETADIVSGSGRQRVSVLPSIGIAQLRVGQKVLINGKTLAIQKLADDVPRTGTQAQLLNWLDDRTALVEDSRSDKRIVLVGEGLTPDTLEAGSEVLLDESVIVQPISKGNAASALGMGSRFLLAEMPDVTFDDIGGLDDELKRLVAALENPHRVPEGFVALHKKPTFSAILMGLPGNGKTMIAKAIARRQFDLHRDKILKYAKGNFFAVGGTELYSKWLGDTERFIREIIGAAQRLYQLTGAISTVFFDDCESFFLTRDAGLSTNINGAVVTQFSTLVEGVREMHGVNLLAATNRLDLVDLAIVRRFDRQIRIKAPDSPERATSILLKHLRDVPFTGITAEEAVSRLVANMFAVNRDNEVVEIFFKKDEEGEDSERIRLGDLISGKFLRDVTEHAKNLVIDREAERPETHRVWALTYDDLAHSLESELRNKESLPATETALNGWLKQKGDKREVDYVINLREKRKGEARRNKAVDEKVV